MSDGLFERVLGAKSLPSLPAVALQVLELTRDPNVSLDEIAKVIQNDQAIAAKVLRTVNSSYFGLSHPCGSISRAIGYLGLNTVKSLVLGFSLVDVTSRIEDGGLDLKGYWQRSIFSAAAARCVADRFGTCNPDEAFTAALFADIGILATFVALPREYAELAGMVAGKHTDLAKAEFEALGFDHAKVGSELAAQWKLPEHVTIAIRDHHKPEPQEFGGEEIARTVALAVLVADSFCCERSPSHNDRMHKSFHDWTGRMGKDVEHLLVQIREDAGQLGDLFDQKVTDAQDVGNLLAEANEALAVHSMHVQQESAQLRDANEQLEQQALTDGLTGIGNRKRFDQELAAITKRAVDEQTPMAALFCDGDKFKSVNDTWGHQAGDEVLRTLASRIGDALGDDGVLCRYGGEEFAMLLPGCDIDRAVAIAERCRAAVAAEKFDTGLEDVPELTVTVSIGAASFSAEQMTEIGAADKLVALADEGVYAAKENGRNRVEVATGASGDEPATIKAPAEPEASAADTAPIDNSPVNILLVEDDPLAAKLLQVVLGRNQFVRTVWLTRADEAVRFVDRYDPNSGVPIHVVLVDVQLPGGGGIDVCEAVRASAAMTDIPVVVLSSNDTHDAISGAMDAGAAEFVSKNELCKNTAHWVDKIVNVYGRQVAAA
jgi:two-component system cell cycle response regulator